MGKRVESWDVTEFAGKTARLVIVDAATGGWGHINVDEIVFTDTPLKKPIREIVADKKYLHFPVKNKGPVRRVKVTAGANSSSEMVPVATGTPIVAPTALLNSSLNASGGS